MIDGDAHAGGAMVRTQTIPTEALVLADVPERTHLRNIQAQLGDRRDDIAALDLDIETLRDTLAAFESEYNGRLATEHHLLTRIHNLTRHLERWGQLLRRAESTIGAEDVATKAHRLDRRRGRELHGTRGRRPGDREPKRSASTPGPATEPASPAEVSPDRLKQAYRSLARRYHPDLARTEQERLSHSAIMTRINALYRTGDLSRLQAMAEQAKGGEIDDPELSIAEQTANLEERLRWFEAVRENLREERVELERSATCQLMRQVRQAEAMGIDLIAGLKTEIQERINSAYDDVTAAVRLVESQVTQFNRKASGPALTRRRQESLQTIFDPFADKRLVRLGLDQLAQGRLSTEARRLADWIEQSAEERPALVRLLMLTHVSELSPFPLEGLETYDDIKLRFDYLNTGTQAPPSLEQALVEIDDLVAYGVKRASDQIAHLGLRFGSDEVRAAIPAALQRLPVRRVLREVLGVLGAVTSCSGCGQDTFPVPLYRLRGLDNMRSTVCPECGQILSSYWMPKGQDVQAVLNATFLDYELISEWSFRLDRGTVATQLVPCQVDGLTVGDLKKRLVDDIFSRYEIEIGRGQVQVFQGAKRIQERTPLAELDHQSFVLRFTKATKLSEADALELVRHRIRNRFR